MSEQPIPEEDGLEESSQSSNVEDVETPTIEEDYTETINDASAEQSSLKDGYLMIIESFIKSSNSVDQEKLSPQFQAFIIKLGNFVEATKENYSFRYVFDIIAQHIKAIIYVNLSSKDILGEEYSPDKYNNLLSSLVSSCNEIIDTFIVKDILINIEQAAAYAVNMPYDKVDQNLNERLGFEINIINKSLEHYAEARKVREDEAAEQQALVMQVMMLLGGLDYKNSLEAKKILIKYWPSKVNIPKKLNLNKVQQLSSIVATDLIVNKKTIQDLVTEFNLDPGLLDALKFTEEDLANLGQDAVTPELKAQLDDENDRIDSMKNEITNNEG